MNSRRQIPTAIGLPRGGILLLHEWWGLTSFISGAIARLTADGWVVVAPDLFRGAALPADAGEAGALMAALTRDSIDGDVGDALTELGTRLAMSGNGTAPVMALGFCLGGSVALHAATVFAGAFRGIVTCYGVMDRFGADWSRIRAPVLGIFGARDHHVGSASVAELNGRLTEADIDHRIHVYAGCEHGFMNPLKPSYHAAQAEDAWRQIADFARLRSAGIPAHQGFTS
jgi:carboxymethylenebutenolidase